MQSRSCVKLLPVSLALSLAFGSVAFGQTSTSATPPYDSYAVKFSCGAALVDADVVKGVYATSVNIHNPQATMPVTFWKKVVTAPEEGTQGTATPPSTIVILNKNETLGPDQAERVDCPIITGALNSGTAHVEGFVVIQVPQQPAGTAVIPLLDVVGKYSARSGASGFDVVRYPPKYITQ
jgi:hypothetical protein